MALNKIDSILTLSLEDRIGGICTTDDIFFAVI